MLNRYRLLSLFSFVTFMAYVIRNTTLGEKNNLLIINSATSPLELLDDTNRRKLGARTKQYNAFIKKGSKQAKALNKFTKTTHIDFDTYEFLELDLDYATALAIYDEFDHNDTTQMFEQTAIISLPNDVYTYTPNPTSMRLRRLDTELPSTVKSLKQATPFPTRKPTKLQTAKPSKLSPFAPTPKTALTQSTKYAGEVKGVVFFIDSLFKNIPGFAGFNVTTYSNYVEAQPCSPHGTSMIEVLTRQFYPEKAKNLKIYNIAAFGCNGHATFATIAAAIQDIRAFIKKHPQVKVVVNFSASSDANNMLDFMFKTLLPKAHINMAASNGDGQDCKFFSPARAAANTVMQSIGALEGQKIAPYSTVATDSKCITLYLPGTLPVTNIWTFRPATVTGTSPACAYQSGRTMVYITQHPKSTPAKTKAAMTSNLNSFVMQQDEYKVRTITEEMAYTWKNPAPTKKPVRHKIGG